MSVIDTDTHYWEPLSAWTDYIDPAFADRARGDLGEEPQMGELLDFDATSKWIEGATRIHYHEAGDGPVLILLHGSGPGVSGWSNFKGNFPVFSAQCRTIIMDMPGFGLSDPEVYNRPYPKHAADAVVRLMDELGIEKAHLLGNSMGGYVTAEAALAHPQRFDRLVDFFLGETGRDHPRILAAIVRGRSRSPENQTPGALGAHRLAPARAAGQSMARLTQPVSVHRSSRIGQYCVSSFSVVTSAAVRSRSRSVPAAGRPDAPAGIAKTERRAR